ncbi:discoidin domain-containing protein [Cellulomonas composti]|uniref:F5/8 type C domain-containing protein n=1 Tax=Cellulomonas composti TaxID=266130 RepID=A0A511JA62_9CELL|nr:discoidin domain-containing protein [Cellulomonas composti]GEL94603.1 hypothetical protein CCO02nite_12610 [Cellulomonas composti]
MSAPSESRTAPPPRQTRRWSRAVAALTVVAVASLGAVATASMASAADVNLALNKTAWASTGTASAAFDGNTNTRWESAAVDGSWIEVDLGTVSSISGLDLRWEGAFASTYAVFASDDRTSWTQIYATDEGPGGVESVVPQVADAHGRFVRLVGAKRATPYGVSLWELQVLGTAGSEPGTDPGEDGPTPTIVIPPPAPGTCSFNTAVGTTATASSGNAQNAIDNNLGTRWESAANNDEWFQIDLRRAIDICGFNITWEGAYADAYTVQVSSDKQTWTTVQNVTAGTGGTEKLRLDTDTTARYVRWNGVTRHTNYGYSFFEFKVLTKGEVPAVPELELPTTELFGPNVFVLDPSMDAADLQAYINKIDTQQEPNQFGDERYQFLLKPGDYGNLDAKIGFYTSVSGLGAKPDDVKIGKLTVDALWFSGNGTQNFWRSVENLSTTGTSMWAVAQAAPMRRVHIGGNLELHTSWWGWTSGGYIADSKIDGILPSYTQQQWYTRDSEFTGFAGPLWNNVFSGSTGVVATDDGLTNQVTDADFPTGATTWLDTTGTVAEKPFLYLDGTDYKVFVPALRNGTTGVTWDGEDEAGESLPLSDFFIVKEGATAAQINAQLDAGKNLLFTPGVYSVDETIQIDRPDTVVLGLGLATLRPVGGVDAMHTADVDGVRIAGLLFDAGAEKSDTVLTLGTAGSDADHADDPQIVQDVFVRVGGIVHGKVEDAIVVNADDTIVDHIWSWRADHGEGVEWGPDGNYAGQGFVVNGDDVSAYGLFVEHYEKYNVLWNGERGRTLFFQNELAYDVPDIDSWIAPNGAKGYAAYKVADGVKEHEAWGLGSYSNFTEDDDAPVQIQVDNAYEVPSDSAGIKMHHLSTVSLGGQGIYSHVINGVGPQAGGNGTETKPSTVTLYQGVDVVLRTPTVAATWPGKQYLGTGRTVTVTVSATGATPTGTVEIREGATLRASAALDASGVARVALPGSLSVGVHQLTVAYLGDAQTEAKSLATHALQVGKATPLITATAGPVRHGVGGTITANVGTTAGPVTTGRVKLINTRTGGVRYANVTDGAVTFTLGKDYPAGITTFRVRYLGSPTNRPVSTVLTIDVKRAKSTTTGKLTGQTASANAVVTGRVTAPGTTPTGKVTARVVSSTGKIVSSRSSNLVGRAYSVTLARLAPGTYTVRVSYGGSESTNPSGTVLTLVVR